MTIALPGPRVDGLQARWWAAVHAGTPAQFRHDVPQRVNRGRALVKGEKVKNLDVSPGLAMAEVHDGEVQHVSIHVRPFVAKEWDKLTAVLTSDLSNVAALFEGTLSPTLMDRLAEAGVRLVPTKDDLDGDCGCTDHVYPCAHLAAVHHVLATVIAADPLELLALRGRTREGLLAALRRAWGGEVAERPHAEGGLAFPDDPFRSPAPLPRLRFDFEPPEAPAAGLRALGPIPGDADLSRALEPIYEAGGKTALAIALGDTAPPPPTAPVVLPEAPRKPRVRMDRGRPTIDALLGVVDERPLTERLVDALGVTDGALTSDLADRVGADLGAVRRELGELERLGLVYRTGATRATRWWLG